MQWNLMVYLELLPILSPVCDVLWPISFVTSISPFVVKVSSKLSSWLPAMTILCLWGRVPSQALNCFTSEIWPHLHNMDLNELKLLSLKKKEFRCVTTTKDQKSMKIYLVKSPACIRISPSGIVLLIWLVKECVSLIATIRALS